MDFEKFSEQVSELLDAPDENKTERIRFKSSLEFVSLINNYISYIDSNYFNATDYTYNDICIDKEFIKNRYEAYKKRAIFSRVDKIADDYIENIGLDRYSVNSAIKKHDITVVKKSDMTYIGCKNAKEDSRTQMRRM